MRPLIYKVVDVLLDRIIAPARWILWPVHIGARIASMCSMALWLLANEYRKRSMGHCGSGVRIHGRLFVSCPAQLHIGNNVHINSNAFLRAEGGLHIGDNVHISRNLVVYTMNHNYQGACLPYDESKILKPVRIERNVWIGVNVCIAPGVTIGEGAIIGMGSVVAKDVAPQAIVGGAPQRTLKHRDSEHYNSVDESGRYGGMSGYPIDSGH